MKPEELKPGRELDALIAEKVMKRPRAHDIVECEDQYYSYCRICGGINDTWDLAETECTADPHYSTDIAAAWEVVEKIQHTGPHVAWYDGKWTCSDIASDMWGCYTDNPDRYDMINDGSYWECSNSAPHAICLAALKATERKSP